MKLTEGLPPEAVSLLLDFFAGKIGLMDCMARLEAVQRKSAALATVLKA